VCSKCGRWNLTPLEERWEAIEECEKQFRATLLRSSTDEIGLGRVREGTDLIRIGKPLRPEFAAWRYARHFERRYRIGIAKVVVSGGLTVTGLVLGGGPLAIVSFMPMFIDRLFMRRAEFLKAQRVVRQHISVGAKLRGYNSVGIRMIQSDEAPGWGIRFAHDANLRDFHGREAVHMAHLVAPLVNIEGGTRKEVAGAVYEIEKVGSPEKYFRRVLDYGRGKNWKYTSISEYPNEMRLAFEMASHEESERIALETELARLEQDWREAEEVAAIADNLFVPQAVTDFIARHRAPKTISTPE
jgi:hypothetical protein